MDGITPEGLQSFLVVLLFLLGAVATVGKAMEVIRSWRSPDRRRDQRIATCETRLAQDFRRLDALEEGNRMQCRALLALLNHAITGNSIDKLKDAQAAINNYLVNK